MERTLSRIPSAALGAALLAGTIGCASAPWLETRPFDAADRAGLVQIDHDARQSGESTCGAAALSAVLRYWGRDVSEGQVLQAATDDETGGIAAGDLCRVAREQGLAAVCFPGEVGDLIRQLEQGRPSIVLVPIGPAGLLHYCVVVGFEPESGDLVLADPSRGLRRASARAFGAAWRHAGNLTVVVAPEESSDREQTRSEAGILAMALPGAQGVETRRFGGTSPPGRAIGPDELAALEARTLPGLDLLRGGQQTIDFESPDFWWGVGLGGGAVFIVMLLVIIAMA